MITLKTPYATFFEVRCDGAILNFSQPDIVVKIATRQPAGSKNPTSSKPFRCQEA